jgi:hypothetical protein
MPTVLCLDDLTCRLAEAAHVLRANAYEVLAADEDTLAVASLPIHFCWIDCRYRVMLSNLTSPRSWSHSTP